MTNPSYNIERIKPENEGGETMIKITIGDQSLLLTEDAAFAFSEMIENTASISEFDEHLNGIFDGWNEPSWTDGSTS